MKTQSKEPVNPSSNPRRRKLDPTFKQEAVSLWLSSGRPAAEVGGELGIRPERLFHWRKTFAPATPGGKGAPGQPEPQRSWRRKISRCVGKMNGCVSSAIF